MIYLRIISNGKTISTFEESILQLIDFVNQNKKTYPFLSSVDYYGVTFFSYKQCKENLIPEMKKMRNEKIEFNNLVDNVIKFGDNVHLHQFLKFIGD